MAFMAGSSSAYRPLGSRIVTGCVIGVAARVEMPHIAGRPRLGWSRESAPKRHTTTDRRAALRDGVSGLTCPTFKPEPGQIPASDPVATHAVDTQLSSH